MLNSRLIDPASMDGEDYWCYDDPDPLIGHRRQMDVELADLLNNMVPKGQVSMLLYFGKLIKPICTLPTH